MHAKVFAQSGPFVPPGNQKIVIIGQDIDNIDAYNSGVGITPGGVTGYINIGDLSGLTTTVDNQAGRNNMGYLYQNYPNSTLAIGVYLVNQLGQINNGQLDNNISELIRILKSWNRPIFLRWGYEVDGPWNSYDPGQFRQAWTRVYNERNRQNADNVVLVWQVASWCGGRFGNNPISSWYPGDQYVDWVAFSYFTPQDCNSSAINDFLNFVSNKNKPIMIAESAPQRYDLEQNTYNPQVQRQSPDQNKSSSQIWNEWFVPYLRLIDNNPKIKAIHYINADWDAQGKWAAPYPEGYWGDSRIQANSTIRSNWRNEIQQGDWLNASSTLFSTLGGSGGNTGGGDTGGGSGGGDTGGGSSSDNFFIVNKGDGTKMGTTATSNNSRVNSLSASSTGNSVQWKRNDTDSGFFFLRHVLSDKHVRPYSTSNGASLRLQPNTWQGARQQYQYVSSGDGYGYIRNRDTGKQLRSYGEGNYIQNRPSSWQGSLNRWKFEDVSGGSSGGGNSGGGDTGGGSSGGNCPASHPVYSSQCNQCFVDAAQAASANCSI